MPRIFLKPNSAEYADEQKPSRKVKGCEMPGCAAEADFKAPKDRSLNEYYHFCLEHVQEYNKAWNFFSGMAQRDIEHHMISSLHGDRPTWRYDSFANLEDDLRSTAWQTYHFSAKKPEDQTQQAPFQRNTPEYEAMLIMELEPPLSMAGIKTRYKELAKRYHPDLNKDDPQAEELLKRVNMAYTILRLAYEKFEKMDTK